MNERSFIITEMTKVKINRKEQIIDAALRLFSMKGYDGSSVREIAESAGVSQGLMYRYFKNKADLLEGILKERSFLPELKRITEASFDKPAQQVLTEIAFSHWNLLNSKPDLVRIVMRESFSNPVFERLFQTMINTGVDILSKYLRARVEMGELKTHEPEITARLIFPSILFLFLSKQAGEQYIPKIVETLLFGISNVHPGEIKP